MSAMVAFEGGPCTSRPSISTARSRASGDPLNAWRTPARVGQAHFANQADDFTRHGRSPLWRATLPSPIESKSPSMPGDHRFGLADHEGRSPAVPELRESHPKRRGLRGRVTVCIKVSSAEGSRADDEGPGSRHVAPFGLLELAEMSEEATG